MFKKSLFVLTGILVLTADQLLKFFLTNSLSPGESLPVIKGVFHITLVLNTGGAFGLFKNIPNLFFLTISLTTMIFLIYFFRCKDLGSAVSKLAAALLIAGSASNLADRLRFGYVIDFLDFRVWPVFNLGDSAITVGVAIFMLKLLYPLSFPRKRESRNE